MRNKKIQLFSQSNKELVYAGTQSWVYVILHYRSHRKLYASQGRFLSFFIVKLVSRQNEPSKEEKQTTPHQFLKGKNNRETAFIHPFNKYLLCSFEMAGTMQGIGDIKWGGKKTVLGLRNSEFCGQVDIEQSESFTTQGDNIMMERITRCNGSLHCIIPEYS